MVYGLLYGMASRDIALCFFLAAFLYSSFGKNQMRYSSPLCLKAVTTPPHPIIPAHRREEA